MASYQEVVVATQIPLNIAQSAVAKLLAPEIATKAPWYMRPGRGKGVMELTPFPLRVNIVFSPKPGKNDISVIKNDEKLEWRKRVWYVSINTRRVPRHALRSRSPFTLTLSGQPEEKINQTLLSISL